MKNLLLVSEHEEVGSSIRAILGENFTIFSANFPYQALKVMKEKPINITIVDTPLREMEMLQFVKEMRNISPENIPIVLFSTSDESLKEELMENGVYEWTTKPFRRTELMYLIQRAEEKLELIKKVRSLERHKEELESQIEIKEKIREERSLYMEGDSQRLFFYYQETLRKFSRILTYIFDSEKLFEMIVTTLEEIFEVGKLALLVRMRENPVYTIRNSVRISEDVVMELRIKEGEGIAGWLSKNGQILTKHSKEISGVVREEMELLEAEVCVPLFSNGELLGFLSLGKKITGEEFTSSELRLLYMMSNYAAIAIQNCYLLNEVMEDKSLLSSILDNIPSGVITIDSTDKITAINNSARKILGIEGKIVGEDIQKAGSIIADIMLRARKEGRVYSRTEIVYPGKNIPLGISALPLKNESKEAVGAVMIFQDLTETKKQEQKSEREKEEDLWKELTRRIADEIRNPLVSISTFAQLLPEKINEENFVRDYYKTVLEAVEKLNAAISRMERFSDASRVNLSLGNINSLLRDLVEEFKEEFKERNIEVGKNLSDSVPNTYIDRDRLMEAFANIIRNSLSAMLDGGKLEITTLYDTEDEQIKITFKDNGKGIEYQDIPRIFSPFYTTERKGFGMGLPIARRVVEKHGGRINVDSLPKKGTTVTISMPIRVPEEKGEEKESIESPVSSPPITEYIPPLERGLSLEEEVARMEKRLISEALKKTKGVKVKAAKMLNISRRVLVYKMEKFGIKG